MEWKDVPGYEGLYEASTCGRIRSLPRQITREVYGDYIIPGKELKLSEDKDGYLKTALRDREGKRKYFRSHRIVAMTFIPNPDNLPVINHLDGNKKNNWIDNLEWVTFSENTLHGFQVLGRKIDGTPFHKPVLMISEDGEVLDRYESITAASRAKGVSITAISQAIRKGNRSVGFYWKLADEGVTTIESPA